MEFAGMNLFATVLAAVVSFMFGWLWYGAIFNKTYKVLAGVPGGEKQGNPGGIMTLVFVTNLVLAFALAEVVMLSGVTQIVKGMFVGVVCGLGFVVTPLLAQHVSEGKPFKLFGINAIYWLIAMGLSGSLLAVWH